MTPFDITLILAIVCLIIAIYLKTKDNGQLIENSWTIHILISLCIELLGIIFIILIGLILYLIYLLFSYIPWHDFFHYKIF